MDQSLKDKIFNRKNILIVLGLVIAVEVVWAIWSLLKPNQIVPTLSPKTVTQQSQPISVSLNADKNQVKVGENFNVSISIFSDKDTDGADLIILYDPKLVSVVDSKTPVLLGGVYSDYPVNKSDQTLGKIIVSGITTTKGGVKPTGLFGSIVFQAKEAGLSKISLDFTPSSTVDTNITETGTGKDILEQVNNLEVRILP